MTLEVHTARVSSRDPDRFDVTRKSGGFYGAPFAPSEGLLRAAKSGALTFGEYEPRYLEEMRRSYVVYRPSWEETLSRSRVVLCCYCVDPDECHRSLLAGILAKLGAVVHGEIGLAAGIAAVTMSRASSGKTTVRDVVAAEVAAGVERCVLWAVLERMGMVRAGTYEAHRREIGDYARGIRATAEAGG